MAITNYSAHNMDLASQMEYLTSIILLNPILDHIFRKAPDLKLEHYYIGAGCITQSIWNHLCGFPVNGGISDIDFVYYDPDLSYDKECEVIDNVKGLLVDIPLRIDIKNQARVHLWYEQHFGYPINPYSSLEEAINTWPTTATAIGLRRNANGTFRVYAPFGLNDLFGLIVRANKAQITKEIYEKKVHRWKSNWPDLTVIPWD
ncbi:nucleotidyltransferase family protein [Paenibacillus alkalitolerans]|uniref:nucleotidyltransferase family protein n=1 Tax=Paenibacillus alkalitolerans TaxID=2799335 RepID=UPI0018F3D3C5|nr:nucleotidyltransferase family protein [Paenibacillus alkalitolerans]